MGYSLQCKMKQNYSSESHTHKKEGRHIYGDLHVQCNQMLQS